LYHFTKGFVHACHNRGSIFAAGDFDTEESVVFFAPSQIIDFPGCIEIDIITISNKPAD